MKIRNSRSLDTGRLREGRIGFNSRVRKSMVFIDYREAKCETICNQRKFGKMTKILSELLGPKSLYGSPTDSETSWK
jgi:hypothetical protein